MFNLHQINRLHAGFLALAILWIAASCWQNKFTHYEGYVYREGRPLPHIEVSDPDVPQRKTYTDERGFFRLDKQKDAVSSIFMVREDDYFLDSIDPIRTAGGERINYYFTNLRSDTLFVKDRIANRGSVSVKLTEKEFWTNDTTMYFGLVTAYDERQGNKYIYYRLEIKEMDR